LRDEGELLKVLYVPSKKCLRFGLQGAISQERIVDGAAPHPEYRGAFHGGIVFLLIEDNRRNVLPNLGEEKHRVFTSHALFAG